MPELPEVECTVRYLEQRLRGAVIEDVHVGWSRIVNRPSKAEFVKILTGSRFKSFSRRGKYIVLEMIAKDSDEKLFLIAHLRMSGSFDVLKNSSLRSKHDHIIFRLNRDRELRFTDVRKFGRMYAVSDSELVLSKLGLEPLEPQLSVKQVIDAINRFKSPIKTVLLRQDVVAGVGNIYADESLWAAQIHPLTPACKLKPQQIEKLFIELKKILRKAIEANGTDNGDNVVYGGMYEPKAYGRAGQPCRRCKTTLKRIVVAQRGTSFCPNCQKR